MMSQKTVVITGAATGIGRSIATKLAENGFKIIGTFNKSEIESAEVRSEIVRAGGKCEMYRVELSKSLSGEFLQRCYLKIG